MKKQFIFGIIYSKSAKETFYRNYRYIVIRGNEIIIRNIFKTDFVFNRDTATLNFEKGIFIIKAVISDSDEEYELLMYPIAFRKLKSFIGKAKTKPQV